MSLFSEYDEDYFLPAGITKLKRSPCPPLWLIKGTAGGRGLKLLCEGILVPVDVDSPILSH